MRLLYTLLFCLIFSNLTVAQISDNITLLYNWQDTTLPGSAAFDNVYNEVWGFVQDNSEYVVIGTTLGTHIFAVDDPVNAQEVAFIPGEAQGPVIIHRDYHDYNGYLYMVSDEGPSTLQIADLSHLPDSAPVVYDSDDLFARAHNIFIDTATAKMYACGGSGNQLSVYSLADPANPTLLVDCQFDVPFWPGTVGYVHDIFVRNDTAYCNAETRGLFVVDFSDTQNPQLIGSLETYDQQGYNHSGWLNGDGTLYAMADETHGTQMKLVDVSDMSDISVTSFFNSGIDSVSIPHNLMIVGDVVVVSHYFDGLYIFNIADPSNPTIAGFYDTSTESHAIDFKGAWGIYPLLPSGIIAVSDMQTGLFLFDASDAITSVDEPQRAPEALQVYPNPFSDGIFYTANGTAPSARYQLHDLTGRLILSGTLSGRNGYIPVPNDLKAGMYLLRVLDDAGRASQTHKLIKR